MRFGNYLRIAQQALKTEQGRAVGRKAADGLAAAGNRVTGNKHADMIEKARQAAYKQLGGPDSSPGKPSPGKG